VKRYLLDTGPLTAWILGRADAVALLQPWISRQEAITSVICQAEALEYIQGFADYRRSRNRILRLLNSVYPTVLSLPILERYGALRRQLRPPHGPGLIGDLDAFIAATELEGGLTLATTDADFARVPGLDVRLVSFAH
jgi:predicted nucleic acid-binding protein